MGRNDGSSTRDLYYNNTPIFNTEVPFTQLSSSETLKELRTRVIEKLQDEIQIAKDIYDDEQTEQSFGEWYALKELLPAMHRIFDEAPKRAYDRNVSTTSASSLYGGGKMFIPDGLLTNGI